MPVLPAAPSADQRYEIVARTLAWAIVVFSWLTAAAASSVACRIFQPHHGMCGNVISDPIYLWLNYLVPLAFVSAVAVSRLCVKSRRWPLICQFSIILFAATLVGLLTVTRFFSLEYGLPISGIWWLPSLARRWFLGR
jgi:hypothetical protein